MNEGQWRAEHAICQHCNHRWAAVCPEEAESLECPDCHGYTAIADMKELLNPPLHLVISRFGNATYLKVSKQCDRLYLAGLLAEALAMVTASGCSVVKPEDCQLRVILSVEKPE
ncbi:hypothetical protein IFO70_10375 [Phormidium tenue FACHB-886]|nr:hypothetical protein [Phormidium tenue FACHB-886]